MTNLPPPAATLLASAHIDEIDRRRILAWASCGFNCAAASRAHPELGDETTFTRTKKRHARALAKAIRTILQDSCTHA